MGALLSLPKRNHLDKASSPLKQMWAGTEQSHDAEDAPNPQMVADAILKLIETKPEERTFRTVVDGTGLNPVIGEINASTEKAMQTIYTAYGMENLLQP
ncbi:hypothetical protein [Vibrio coralliilyticus]|uniref:hypothetical protein n=1 Tax=Vibrio coralliilyticus TaxID=190893 RepID=UPI0015CA8F33|nr:hypothetical protein [Vibrio coralliilyticus]MCC2523830.1 hypothetical protein [Vibrio coralliilyticus]